MQKESSVITSSSPLTNKEKVQPRYLSRHTSSRHDFCKHGKNLEVEPEANSLNPKQTIKKTKKSSQPAVSNQITLLDSPKFPDRTKIHQSRKNQEKHEDSDNEYPKIKIAQENTNSSVMKIVSQLSKAAPVKEVTPFVSGEGKTSVASKTKIRLIRSSSRNRPLHNSSIQIKHAKETKDIPDASEVSETESENGQEKAVQSKKIENNISSSSITRAKSIKRTASSANRIVLSLQLKKLRSLRRTTTHEYVLSYPLNEVNSTNKNAFLLESSSSAQLTKAKSSKKNSSTHVEVKSNKQNAEALERDSSLEATKLKSISENKASNESDKKKPSKNESISNMVSRKFMSIMRNSTVKNKNKEVKTEIEPNAEEESLCEVNAKLGLPRSRTTREEENGAGTLKIRRATVINRSKSVSGGRRLWFNIGKVANSESGTVASGLTRKRSLRIKRGGFSSKDFELQSVVLKHQKTMKKNDMETLFNEVIEKTASKLRGSKKSKVKALVGAFENVISLQGGKPVSAV